MKLFEESDWSSCPEDTDFYFPSFPLTASVGWKYSMRFDLFLCHHHPDFSNRIKSLKIRWDFCIMLILSFFSSKLQTASPVLLWVLPHHCIGCLPLNILIYFLIFSFVLQLFEYIFLDFLLQMTFYKNQNEIYSSLSHLGPVSFFLLKPWERNGSITYCYWYGDDSFADVTMSVFCGKFAWSL